ncbi:hypothetical protein CEXT_810261 [Caerostris extrusa]|uniref:Uncharacterized protein n=1 Tax=Caerostris extrusa TaxID=172846 RepID=A0AAV4UD98_CAEEX|nr:hypothetical protein CEXT_810261 [Caerostris extrusa]
MNPQQDKYVHELTVSRLVIIPSQTTFFVAYLRRVKVLIHTENMFAHKSKRAFFPCCRAKHEKGGDTTMPVAFRYWCVFCLWQGSDAIRSQGVSDCVHRSVWRYTLAPGGRCINEMGLEAIVQLQLAHCLEKDKMIAWIWLQWS